jgi:hypothetical protein
MALTLTAMAGIRAVAGSERRISRTLKPLMSGRLTSIRITSGRDARASSMPLFPSTAVSKRNAEWRAMICSTSFRSAGLSSN